MRIKVLNLISVVLLSVLFIGFANPAFSAYDSTKLKAVGGQDGRDDGGDIFSYAHDSDTLTTIIAADYFLEAYQMLNPDDIIRVVHTTGWHDLLVVTATSAGVTVAAGDNGLVLTQSLSGAGAADILSEITELTTTSTDAITLADGAYIGQKKIIILKVDGGNATLTPTTALGWTTCTFADAGDSITLRWTSLGWALVGQGGLGTGPLTA